MEDIVKKYSEKLKRLGVEHELLPHPKMKSVEEVMNYLGYPVSDGLSTLVMKADGKFVAIIRRDDFKLSKKKARKLLQVKNLEMASGEEFEKLTGLPSGAVHVVPPVEKILLDKQVLKNKYIIGGSGSLSVSCKYKSSDLKKIPGLVVADVVKNKIEYSKIKRVLSGITPSGNTLHLGNYAGAVKPQFDLLEKGVESYYFVADLHALTTIQDKDKLEECIVNNIFDYIALGLDPEKGIYFRQSDVPEHSMLAVVLANYIPFGLTNRMHAFKDKLAKGVPKENINMGLFNYPILMAADILLYKPDGVPVGEDQRQHVEFARNTAKFFNNTHGNTFPIPEPLIGHGNTARVVGTDGERKMSKSLGNVINIFDDEKVIRRQIMGSYTDPNRKRATDLGKVEGNPVFIYHDIINDDKEGVKDLKERYSKGKVGDVEVKEKLFEAHKRKFDVARKRRKELEGNINLAKEILAKGAERARKVAQETMREVYEIVGIINKLN
ncbi:tryptophan--tRNA ligase [Patescibacteria group bacterium]|nr:tryptophan--tRNA ligase [Patescibacteria group bacterium]